MRTYNVWFFEIWICRFSLKIVDDLTQNPWFQSYTMYLDLVRFKLSHDINILLVELFELFFFILLRFPLLSHELNCICMRRKWVFGQLIQWICILYGISIQLVSSLQSFCSRYKLIYLHSHYANQNYSFWPAEQFFFNVCSKVFVCMKASECHELWSYYTNSCATHVWNLFTIPIF